MASFEIPKSPFVLGIDLGTTNSSASVYTSGEAIPLKIGGGQHYTLPSVVWFPDGKREGVRIGKEAKQKIFITPEHVFSSAKSHVRSEQWKNDEGLKNKYDEIDGELSPIDVLREILREILNQAQSHQTDFDLRGDIQQVVICVPANTTETYRRKIYQIAKDVGLGIHDENDEVIMEGERPKGVYILEEPTAAALAYGLDQGFLEEGASKEQNILVYDMGGGTFDVTILHVDASENVSLPRFSVLSTRGVAQLGGDDFDMAIMQIASEKFRDETEIDVLDTVADNNGTTKAQIKQAQQKLKEAAEEAKIALAGGFATHEITIPNFVKDGDGVTHNLELEVSRDEVLERIQPLLDQASDCVLATLSDANMSMDEINRIVLVGGSTRAEWVTESIEKLGKKPYVSKNVDVMVARGAAFFGANTLVDDIGVEIKTKTSHHMGIELAGAKFSLILEKDLDIDEAEGVSITKTFKNKDQQESVNIAVYKTQDLELNGEEVGSRSPDRDYFINERMGERKRFEFIGDFQLSGIPMAPRGTEEIDVTMSMSRDQVLKVTAVIKSNNRTADVTFNL